MSKYQLIAFVSLLLFSCKSAEEFTGYSYDPPDVTNTLDKEIEFQKKRTIGAGTPKIWVSNEYDGARMNDFYAVNDTLFEVMIKPERSPINNSAWYGFRIWSEKQRTITLRMRYENGRHRYQPKAYFEANIFSDTPVDTIYNKPIEISYDTSGVASFELTVGELPIILTAQWPFNTTLFDDALESPLINKYAKKSVVGYSHQQKPIYELEIDETDPEKPAGVLIILSRQHPPEVTGFLSSMFFLENMLGDNDLAKEFRKHFVIKAYPMINPDGVDNGHWRNNMAGNDLNRDWEFFNQPETRAVRDALLPLLKDSRKRVYYGIDFHSTNENIFYPIDEEIVTFPDNFTQRWQDLVKESNTDVVFNTEEFPTDSPIAKNWIFKTFGADAVTFEVDDALNISDNEEMSYSASQLLMQLLLDEFNKNN
tara:strand:- start:1569 stop:2840 length:1272 start_codon:yes stop_codon:yes gene_type:complete